MREREQNFYKAGFPIFDDYPAMTMYSNKFPVKFKIYFANMQTCNCYLRYIIATCFEGGIYSIQTLVNYCSSNQTMFIKTS